MNPDESSIFGIFLEFLLLQLSLKIEFKVRSYETIYESVGDSQKPRTFEPEPISIRVSNHNEAR